MTRALGQVWVLVWKDLAIDLRRKENLLAMFFFALLTLLIFGFALHAADEPHFRVTPRVLAQVEADGAGPAARTALLPLQGRSFADQGELLAALSPAQGAGGAALTLAEKLAVLRHARHGPLEESMAGLLWVTFVLAGVLGLSKSFGQERDQGCMDGLLLTPVPRGVIYLGKMLSNTLFLALILALLLPLCALLFQVNLAGLLLPIGAVLLAGALGFSALGTLLGGITSSLKGREVLLPLLLFPLLVPLLLVAVHLTDALLAGESLADHTGWLQLLGAFDAIFLIVSYLTFEYVMES
jgi:heme exporter protein B